MHKPGDTVLYALADGVNAGALRAAVVTFEHPDGTLNLSVFTDPQDRTDCLLLSVTNAAKGDKHGEYQDQADEAEPAPAAPPAAPPFFSPVP